MMPAPDCRLFVRPNADPIDAMNPLLSAPITGDPSPQLPNPRRDRPGGARLRPWPGVARLAAAGLAGLCLGAGLWAATPAATEVERLKMQGEANEEGGSLVISAQLKPPAGPKLPVLLATHLTHQIDVSTGDTSDEFDLDIEMIQGWPKEIVFGLAGQGDILDVILAGDWLAGWSVRHTGEGKRALVLELSPTNRLRVLPRRLTASVIARHRFPGSSERTVLRWEPLRLVPERTAWFDGWLRIVTLPLYQVRVVEAVNLTPLDAELAPEELRPTSTSGGPPPLFFQFHGRPYALELVREPADPEAGRITLRDARLEGELSDRRAAFTLTGTLHVAAPKGSTFTVLQGDCALTGINHDPAWRARVRDRTVQLVFDEPGDYPIELRFEARVTETNGWNQVRFRVAPAVMQRLTLRGLPEDTRFRFPGAALPQREGEVFRTLLPADGAVALDWSRARPETEGRLFYAVEAFSQVTVSPGLLRQTDLLELSVLQGEMSELTFALDGPGEVTRVQGAPVLAWEVQPAGDDHGRRLHVKLNQPQKGKFSLQVQMQSPLGSFPQTIDTLRLTPVDAIRHGGHVRVANDGAVRLEVVEARGMSQISPEQLPQSGPVRQLLPAQATQVFAFRFSGTDTRLRVQADNILPELGVSEVLTYQLGDTALSIEAELELDIREAPIRELSLAVPAGFAVASLQGNQIADYTLGPAAGTNRVQLRILFAGPVTERQLIQLRLERNEAFAGDVWTLPRIEVADARTTRGHVGVACAPAFRLTPQRTDGLTEIATAFFPRRIENIQAAFRIADPAWTAALRVERVARSIQAEVFHLFSVGEAIAYGSSVMNFVIAGAPVDRFRIELSPEYYNVEFTGKDVLHYRPVEGGYEVQLSKPAAGDYTLLATYERPFKAEGETLTFVGARPLEVQSEQGHTIVISTYQFQVEPADVSPGLIRLEPGEVPAEYRLFFDAPILAAYRYTARPFNLRLTLRPLTQAATLQQVVDRAQLQTRISEEGQVLTTARYFLKNKGQSFLRVRLAPEAELWKATVDGRDVVPVQDGQAHLVPLPQTIDPNQVHEIELALAGRSPSPRRIRLQAPVLAAPVLLTDWQLTPDANRRLVFRGGSLAPATPAPDLSGFAEMGLLLRGGFTSPHAQAFAAALILFLIAALSWRWATAEGVWRFSARHWVGTLLGGVAVVAAVYLWLALIGSVAPPGETAPVELHFLAPVQQAGSVLELDILNADRTPSFWSRLGTAWPAIVGLLAALACVLRQPPRRRTALALAWTGILWSALRWPHGGAAFLGWLLALIALHVLLPLLVELGRRPPKPRPEGPADSGPTPDDATPTGPAAAGAAALLVLGLAGAWGVPQAAAQPQQQVASRPAIQRAGSVTLPPPLLHAPAESVFHQARAEKDTAVVQARLVWRPSAGDNLLLVQPPAVLEAIEVPDGLRVAPHPTITGAVIAYAEKGGDYRIVFTYRTPIEERPDGVRGFHVPVEPGLINQLELEVPGPEREIVSPDAVSIVPRPAETGAEVTRALLVLDASSKPWIAWQPPTRDTRREKTVFYAECFQLFVPTAGLIEGSHVVEIRPAQGELTELAFRVPEGMTITDVLGEGVEFWRFDPDQHLLRVNLAAARAQPFSLTIGSQVAVGPLPFSREVGLIAVQDAANQLGLAGVATSPEVQLEKAETAGLTAINLEDFPATVVATLQDRIPGLTLRRAFRYADPAGRIILQAAPVQPDVRVVSDQSLSLGADRILLAAGLDVTITRAGLFKLSFLLPAGLDIESLSGPALSHWTELKSPEGRIITLHLKGRTLGRQRFDLSLVGPGLGATNGWTVPRLLLREASKQQGRLVIVPEQGMRLDTAERRSVTPLDPAQAGVRARTALAFRLLNADWQLSLDIEQLAAWIQVTGFQQVSIQEGQARVTANLDYQIENAGVRTFRLRLPAQADNVRFTGPQLADFLPLDENATNQTRLWEVKLHRRVLGGQRLEVAYTLPLPDEADTLAITGVVAEGVNVQRGFLALQATGRVQLTLQDVPDALRPAEWESVPAALRENLASASVSHVFRLVQPDYRLVLGIRRHQATPVLPARVRQFQLTSVISDAGVILTRGRVELVPGDKRLLRLRLPDNAEFWFAFVNEGGVWLWREGDDILIPLQQTAALGETTTVDFYYTTRAGDVSPRRLDLRLHGPRIDLPLRQIEWRVFLDPKWELTDWEGDLQLTRTELQERSVDLEAYLQEVRQLQQRQSQAARKNFELGNRLILQGDVQNARRFLNNAYQLSQGDLAFNEDARVQLRNLKTEQALIGLNVQRGLARQPAQQAELRQILEEANYTREQARALSQNLPAEDLETLTRLAEKIVEQQDAAVANPTAIRASVPEQGRMFLFARSLQVDPSAGLELQLEARAARAGSALARLLAVAACFLLALAAPWLGRRRPPAAS